MNSINDIQNKHILISCNQFQLCVINYTYLLIECQLTLGIFVKVYNLIYICKSCYKFDLHEDLWMPFGPSDCEACKFNCLRRLAGLKKEQMYGIVDVWPYDLKSIWAWSIFFTSNNNRMSFMHPSWVQKKLASSLRGFLA